MVFDPKPLPWHNLGEITTAKIGSTDGASRDVSQNESSIMDEQSVPYVGGKQQSYHRNNHAGGGAYRPYEERATYTNHKHMPNPMQQTHSGFNPHAHRLDHSNHSQRSQNSGHSGSGHSGNNSRGRGPPGYNRHHYSGYQNNRFDSSNSGGQGAPGGYYHNGGNKPHIYNGGGGYHNYQQNESS